MLVPAEVETGETLRGHAALAIEVGGRCRGLDGLEVQVSHKAFRDGVPEFRHGDVGILVVFHEIHSNHISSGGFVLHLQTLLVGQVCHCLEEIPVVKVTLDAAPLIQETGGSFLTVQHIARQSGHPAAEGIAGAGKEFLLHFSRPRLVVALPAVHQHSVGQALQRPFLQAPHIMGKLNLGPAGIQLVAFPAGGFGRCRTVAVPAVHVAETENRPIASFGRGPREGSVGLQERRKVLNLIFLHKGGRVLAGSVLIAFLRTEGAAGAGLPVVHPGGREEAHVADVNVVLIGEGEFQLLSGARGLIHRQGHRLVVLPASHRQVAVQQGFPLPVRADAHQRKLHPRGVHEVPAEAVQTGKFQRPHHGAFRQGEGDAVGGSALCIQGFPLAKKGRPIGLNGTYIPDFQWLSRISQRGRESQHTNVPIVSPLLLRRLALGKDTLPGRSAKNVRPAPDQVSHRIFGLYPGPAGHSPAGTGLDGEPKIQAAGFLAQIRDHLVPIRGKRHHRGVHARPSTPEGAVEPLDAGYPGPGDGLQVCIHSFPGYIIPNKMEPGFRPEDLGR